MIITVKIRTEPPYGSMGKIKEADHAEIIISNLRSYLQDRYPDTEISGVEWGTR
jgi:hypothetical protein